MTKNIFDLTLDFSAAIQEYVKLDEEDEIFPLLESAWIKALACFSLLAPTLFIKAFNDPQFKTDSHKQIHEDAEHYYSQTFQKQYKGKSKQDQIKVFANDLNYWSDRWCYSRIYTMLKIWEMIMTEESNEQETSK